MSKQKVNNYYREKRSENNHQQRKEVEINKIIEKGENSNPNSQDYNLNDKELYKLYRIK